MDLNFFNFRSGFCELDCQSSEIENTVKKSSKLNIFLDVVAPTYFAACHRRRTCSNCISTVFLVRVNQVHLQSCPSWVSPKMFPSSLPRRYFKYLSHSVFS